VRSCGLSSSKKIGSIGFLKSSNRTNVLLSRAKEGMYIVGQADLFERESSFWASTLNTMRSDGLVDKGVTIYCQKHPDHSKTISNPREFAIFSPDGGCLLPCGVKLPNCGHSCPRLCHSDIANHVGIFCPKPCLRLYPRCEHSCPKACGETCGNCELNVGTVTLPCLHIYENTKCFMAQTLENIDCRTLVLRTLSLCGHSGMLPCMFGENDLACSEICSTVLDCGHLCSLKCHKNEPAAHGKCKVRCEKNLLCQHVCGQFCHMGDECPPCQQPCKMMKCSHSKCKHPCYETCEACTEKCKWSCTHKGFCPLPCGAPCVRELCNRRCERLLPCKHQCPSLCGEICPGKNFCQECLSKSLSNLSKSMLDQVVDLLEFTTYRDLNLNEQPILVMDCKHFFAMDTLDGVVDLQKYYGIDGKCVAVDNELSIPPACPTCRSPIIQIFRYGRIIKQAMLDQSEKRVYYHIKSGLREATALVEKFQAGSRNQSDIQSKLSLLERLARYPPSKRIHEASLVYLEASRDEEPMLVLPKLQKNLLGEVLLQVSRFNRHLWIGLRLEQVLGFLKTAKESLSLLNQDLQFEAQSEIVNWSIIEFAKISSMELVPKFVLKLYSVDDQKDLISKLQTRAASILSEVNKTKNAPKGSVYRLEKFISTGKLEKEDIEIDLSEMAQIYSAMNLGSGHWYRCM
jgi:hypothetical protein